MSVVRDILSKRISIIDRDLKKVKNKLARLVKKRTKLFQDTSQAKYQYLETLQNLVTTDWNTHKTNLEKKFKNLKVNCKNKNLNIDACQGAKYRDDDLAKFVEEIDYMPEDSYVIIGDIEFDSDEKLFLGIPMNLRVVDKDDKNQVS